MKNIEVAIIALLSTGLALFTWLMLSTMGGEEGFFDSIYTALIFPPIYVGLFLSIRYWIRIGRHR